MNAIYPNHLRNHESLLKIVEQIMKTLAREGIQSTFLMRPLKRRLITAIGTGTPEANLKLAEDFLFDSEARYIPTTNTTKEEQDNGPKHSDGRRPDRSKGRNSEST